MKTKKSHLSVIYLLVLVYLLLAMPYVMAEELAVFSETILETPEQSLLIDTQGSPDGSILALASNDDGYNLLKWKDPTDVPEVIPVTVSDLELSIIDIAPDGEIALMARQKSSEVDENGLLSFTFVVIWLDASGQEVSRIYIDGETPMAQKALSGRRLACATWFDELIFYDDAGNVLKKESVMDMGNLATDAHTLYVFTSNTVLQWSLDTYEKADSMSIESISSSEVFMTASGEVYFISNGVKQIDLQTGIMYPVMDPVGTCLGSLDNIIKGFVALPGQQFLFHVKKVGTLPAYEHLRENNYIAIYRETEVTGVRQPFVITGIRYSLLAEKAASEFQKLHPELKVDLKMLGYQFPGLGRDELIQMMNTALLTGNAGDVLLLDHLSIDALASRGMLLDIAHVAEDAGLLNGISKSLGDADGKIYTIPAEFGVFQLWGKDIDLKSIQTLPDLLDMPVGQGQMRLPMSTTLWHLFAVCKPDFTGENGEILFQSDAFIDFLKLLYGIYDEIDQEAYGISQGDRRAIDIDAFKNGAIALSIDLVSNFSKVDEYFDWHGEEGSTVALLPSLNGTIGTYHPSTILGISKDTQNPALAEEFIRLMLSDDVSFQNFSAVGFSTVERKLDRMFELRIELSNTQTTGVGLDEDGIRAVRPTSEAHLHVIREMLIDVSIPYYNDLTIIAFIEEGLQAMLEGNTSAEEAARVIEQRADLYLNE